MVDALSVIGLSVRIGLHTGEIETGPEGTTGLAMHVAARVMAVATEGEIVVARTVKELVLGSDIVFADLESGSCAACREPGAHSQVADTRVPHGRPPLEGHGRRSPQGCSTKLNHHQLPLEALLAVICRSSISDSSLASSPSSSPL